MKSLQIPKTSEQNKSWLKRTSFEAGIGTKNEDWLQEVLFENSDLLPIKEINPGSSGFVPICRELTIPKSGPSVYLDLFGVTPEGKLVLIECKLWRNPQARREVIAQTLEYAALMKLWSFGDLTARVNSKLKTNKENPIYEIVAEAYPDIDEAQFVDKVTQSLKLGDFILIIAGDGIRSDLHAIADYLNRSGGLNSNLSLVEFCLWENDIGDMIIIPAIPFRTEILQQRVIVSEDGTPLSYTSPQSTDVDTEAIIDPEREAAKEAEKAFWQSFIDRSDFDHPDQSKPRHGNHGWVRMEMPDPASWITAYRTKQGKGGLFMRLKGEDGQALYSEFEAAQDQLSEELGFSLELEAKKAEPFEGLISINYDQDVHDNDKYLEWLLQTSNKLASVLRPFINQVS